MSMSKILSKNIDFLMRKHGIKNLNLLAKRANIPQPTLFRWMNENAREPRHSSLVPLASFFGVSVNDVVSIDFETGDISTEVTAVSLRKEVCLFDISEVNSNMNFREHENRNTVPVVHARVSNDSFAIEINGDSMSPEMPAGAVAIVDANRKAKGGDYVVAAHPVTYVPIIRKLVEEGGCFYLHPENKMFEAIKLKEIPQIFGVVAEMQVVKVFH